MEEWFILLMYAIAAACVAVVFRFRDWPATEFVPAEFAKTYVGAIIAVGMTMWFVGFENLMEPQMFAVVAGAGVGGMAAVGALIGQPVSEATA